MLQPEEADPTQDTNPKATYPPQLASEISHS